MAETTAPPPYTNNTVLDVAEQNPNRDLDLTGDDSWRSIQIFRHNNAENLTDEDGYGYGTLSLVRHSDRRHGNEIGLHIRNKTDIDADVERTPNEAGIEVDVEEILNEASTRSIIQQYEYEIVIYDFDLEGHPSNLDDQHYTLTVIDKILKKSGSEAFVLFPNRPLEDTDLEGTEHQAIYRIYSSQNLRDAINKGLLYVAPGGRTWEGDYSEALSRLPRDPIKKPTTTKETVTEWIREVLHDYNSPNSVSPEALHTTLQSRLMPRVCQSVPRVPISVAIRGWSELTARNRARPINCSLAWLESLRNAKYALSHNEMAKNKVYMNFVPPSVPENVKHSLKSELSAAAKAQKSKLKSSTDDRRVVGLMYLVLGGTDSKFFGEMDDRFRKERDIVDRVVIPENIREQGATAHFWVKAMTGAVDPTFDGTKKKTTTMRIRRLLGMNKNEV